MKELIYSNMFLDINGSETLSFNTTALHICNIWYGTPCILILNIFHSLMFIMQNVSTIAIINLLKSRFDIIKVDLWILCSTSNGIKTIQI